MAAVPQANISPQRPLPMPLEQLVEGDPPLVRFVAEAPRQREQRVAGDPRQDGAVELRVCSSPSSTAKMFMPESSCR